VDYNERILFVRILIWRGKKKKHWFLIALVSLFNSMLTHPVFFIYVLHSTIYWLKWNTCRILNVWLYLFHTRRPFTNSINIID
jgi:TRAP-type C4-dicarboxylate transport system permease small subunit